MINKGLFTSLSGDWRTPKELYAELDREFHFDFDPCPYPRPNWDGLKRSWGWRNYVNPPYGREIKHWISKGIVEYATTHCIVVFLLPARTDTSWFWKLLDLQKNPLYHVEFRFIKGRLHFSERGPAPFPSVVVILS